MKKDHIKHELIVIFAIVSVSFLVFTQIDVLEMIVALSAKYEHYEIDELVASAIVFAGCMVFFSIRRWRESHRYNKLLTLKNSELQTALNEVKVLQGILPICSYCKKIRDSDDSWKQLEHYIHTHSDAQFSHGICPECSDIAMKELNEMPSNKDE